MEVYGIFRGLILFQMASFKILDSKAVLSSETHNLSFSVQMEKSWCSDYFHSGIYGEINTAVEIPKTWLYNNLFQ